MYSKGCLSEPSDSYTGLRVGTEVDSSQSVNMTRIRLNGFLCVTL